MFLMCRICRYSIMFGSITLYFYSIIFQLRTLCMQYGEDKRINAFKMFIVAVVDPKFKINGNCARIRFCLFIAHFRPLIECNKYFIFGFIETFGRFCRNLLRFYTKNKGTFFLFILGVLVCML